MVIVNRLTLAGTAFSAALLMAAGAANAANYNFVVNYQGSGTAVLAGGSDDLLATTLTAGDTFTYTLNAQAGFQWNTVGANDLFPFLALSVGPPVTTATSRFGDPTVDLFSGASNVFHFADTGAQNCCVHLGTNTVSVSDGLHFDQWVLQESFTSGPDATADSLLPWPGTGPENFFAGKITYTGAEAGVPEPGAWALMLLGFGGLGGLIRARRTVAATA
jgi:hypothetical protein